MVFIYTMDLRDREFHEDVSAEKLYTQNKQKVLF